MKPPTSLTGSHLRTYETIFQHPVSHNLGWHDVHALFRQLGEIEEEPNGNLKVTRNGQTLVLNPPRAKDVETADEVIALRHFIERSETPPLNQNDPASRWLVVIDHHEARIYRSTAAGAIAQQIRSHTPEDFFRHAPDSKAFSRGYEKSESRGYFEPVASVLKGAGQILVFGTGKGTSNEMDQFTVWLKHHRPELAGRIIGTKVVGEYHLTDAQLLAKAREFHADLGRATTTIPPT